MVPLTSPRVASNEFKSIVEFWVGDVECGHRTFAVSQALLFQSFGKIQIHDRQFSSSNACNISHMRVLGHIRADGAVCEPSFAGLTEKSIGNRISDHTI